MLRPYVAPGMTVLDVGCGMGFFSIGMARLVGSDGLVISLDVQHEMLDVLRKRAVRAGVSERIRTYRCTPNDLCVATKVDFILAFWVVHEVPDQKGFFRQLRPLAQVDSYLLFVEPKLHVSSERFQRTLEQAMGESWRYAGDPSIRLSRSAILRAATPGNSERRGLGGC
jgi:2-polyprenyl-3-methyl-5-hydroxy-6-metoxy-1,4-benzoquinol methylase